MLYLRLSKQNLATLDNNNQLRLKLFPNYFKKVGLILILLVAAVFIYLIWAQPVAIQQTKDLVKSILQSVFLAGILLIAVARDRVEDEQKQLLRLKAMATAFVFGMVYAIIDPFISLFFRTTENHDARELVGTMLIFYLVLFYILKQRRR